METLASTPPRLGVEEEYLVIDPDTRAVTPRAAQVVAAAVARLGERAGAEITQFQVEARTAPCATADELEHQLREMREAVAAAAAEQGARAIASGTPVTGDCVPPPITELSRYDLGIANYRALHDEQAICAAQVHVELPDRNRAVLVSNHLRPWLPVLLALMANSPFWAGRDTGYASWRTLCWGKWPVAGPPPYFSSYGEYEKTVAELAETGALVDVGTVFWDVRPAARLPTLEVRVADVPVTSEETGLLARIVRALVMVSLSRVDHDDPGPAMTSESLRAAYWRAARDGLDGEGMDPLGGGRRRATDLVDVLLRHIRPALEVTEDLDLVAERLERLRTGGTGAARQRAALSQRGQITDVVDYLTSSFASPFLEAPTPRP